MKDFKIEISLRGPRKDEGETQALGIARIVFDGEDSLQIRRKVDSLSNEPEESLVELWIKLSWLIGGLILERAKAFKEARPNP